MNITIELPELHGGQLRVERELGRRNVLMCGRRWGKTTFLEDRALTHGGVIEGQPVGFFVPSYKYLPETWDRFVSILQPIIASVSKQDRRIVTTTGGVLDVWSLENEDAGRGRKYAKAIIDEAGLVPNLEHIWTRSLRPTLTDLRGVAILGGTPQLATAYFVSLYHLGQGGDADWRSWKLKSAENPHIPREEIEDARREYDLAGLGHVFRQEYEAEPSEDGGSPFGIENIRACIASLSPAEPVAIGADLAKSVDWTVVVGLDEDGVACLFERFQRPWNETEEDLSRLVRVPALIDSTGVGDPIVESLARRTGLVEGFKFTGTSRQQLLEGLRAEIHRRAIRFPDGQLVRELESFAFRFTGRGGVTYRAPDALHDDCVMALALAVWKWKELGYGAGPTATRGDRVPTREELEDDVKSELAWRDEVAKQVTIERRARPWKPM